MLKRISNERYDAQTAYVLKRYEEAGFTPVQCMSDITDLKSRYASDDGYADGCLVGGIALFIGGVICKILARKELRQMNNSVNAKLNMAMSMMPLTDFKVPGSDDANREENND